MKLTANFQISEFSCHDGTRVPDKYIQNVLFLAQNLQVIRNELGDPLTILSGYRTESWNKKIGGAEKSQHKLAKAADLTCKSKTPKQLHSLIRQLIKEGKIKDGGLGLYKGFVHYDVGESRRWNG